MSKLVLEVSLGEALDKLTILDIKCEMIKDYRKNDCLKEYTVLLNSLKQYVDQFSFHYRILKEINLTIWRLQDSIHKSTELTSTYGEILKENDRRFRVKKQINNLANSSLKEQKGYAKTRCFIYTHLGLGDHFWMNGAVRYLATCYDETTVVVKQNNEAVVRSMYLDDSSIKFYVINDDMELYPFVARVNYLQDEGYAVYSCGFHVTDKQPSIYEFPHSFYDDIKIPREIRTNYFYTTSYKESKELYDEIVKVSSSYILIHQKSSQKKLNIFNSLNTDLLVLDINENHYSEGHIFHNVAELVVNKQMLYYKELAENAKEIHCLESSFYCYISHLDLSKVEKKVCYEPFDNSAERIGVFQTGSALTA
jgi:hypothetical protein